MAGVRLRGVHKRYGATPVLSGVDLEVRDGEYVVLLGPSGCGKSTLLRCVAGLEGITSGDLWIGDRRVNDVAPRDRDVAMVFQSYALYPHMTVRQNMGFALQIAGRPSAEVDAAVSSAAELLDLSHLLDRTPAQLSGGQRQRVAMGRAIVRRPSVFLFDEPLSNLDAALRGHMRVELKRLHRRLGTTVIHVTHDQVEALTLADRIVLLDRGVVQQIGAPREVWDRPANRFVAGFIGSPPMNFLPEGDRVVGVRPTDVRLGAGPRSGVVDVVESLGAEGLVHLRVGDLEVVAVAGEPVAWRPGDTVQLAFAVEHRFDAVTGARL